MGVVVSELLDAVLQAILFLLIPFLWWLMTARKSEGFLPWMGFRKVHHTGRWLCTALGTVLAVTAYGILTSALMAAYSEGITAAGSSFAGMGMAALPAVIVYSFIRTGFSEEFLFRGFLLKRISRRWGFIVGNTVQALLFGALHGIPFGLATHRIPVTVLLTLLPGALGWYFGWLNEKRCGGSVVPSWLLHGLMNTVVACLAL